MKLITFFFLAFLTLKPAQADFFSKKDFELALGVQANSLLYKRGIITYGGNQVFPIYSVTLFNPNLLLAGSALYYKHKIFGENFSLRARLNTDSTLDRPLYYSNEEKGERVEREITSEFDIFLEYIMDNYAYFRLQSSTDLVASNGQYFELYGHYPLLNLSSTKNSKSLLLLGAYGAIGYGDLKHNEYLYGEGADDFSLNNIEYGVTIRSPKVIDVFWPTLKITRFQILGDGNRNASHVKEKDGWSVEALAAFKVW